MAIIDRIILSSGWRRALIAALSGAFGALALAPFNIWPAMFVPMVIAVWLLDGVAPGEGRFSLDSLRAAAWIGWCWGFGYFVAGLWWIGAAFLVEADKFAALMPLGILGLPAALAFFPAFGFALAWGLWSSGLARVFAFAFALALSEWLRGHLFTGFPWNEPGMALGGNIVLGQAAALVGLYGLNILSIVIFAAPAVLVERARLAAGLGIALAGLVILSGFGALRLAFYPTEMVKGVKLRLMQPNLPLDNNFRPENKMVILQKYLALSDRSKSSQSAGIRDVTHLIWPESPLPTLLARDAEVLTAIGTFLPPGTILITGAIHTNDLPNNLPASGQKAHYFNAMQAVASGGTIVASYDKVHLVPFGEYLPLERFLRAIGLTQFVQTPGGFDAGTWIKPLKVAGLPVFAPVICYEAIFPGEIIAPGERPGLILNITNDTWFGQTPGPYQHMAQARLRAIEEGLPLVRAANSGISAVVDPVGRIIGSLPLNVEDVLDAPLPKAISATVFARFGNYMLAGLFILSLGAALAGRRRS